MKGRTLEAIAQLFVPQRGDDDCLPTALKCILDESSDRLGIAHRVTRSRIERACDYEPGGASVTDPVVIKAALDVELRRAKQVSRHEFGPSVTDKTLQSLLASEGSSFPVLEFHRGWMADPVLPRKVNGTPDGWTHAVILLDLGEADATVYDPLQRHLSPTGALQDCVLKVPLVRFQKHWSSNTPPRWTFWVDRADRKPRDRSLLDYAKT